MKTKQLLLLSVAIFSLFAFQSAQKIYTYFFDLQSLPTEKVYLHLDKPHYALGSTIWFKAYLQTERHSQLDSMSKVLYVELIKPDNQLHQRLTLKIEEGAAKGNIAMLDTLEAGNFRLRAYTNYMRNFENYFEQNIAVVNPTQTSNSLKRSESNAEEVQETSNTHMSVKNLYAFQCFPEGGDLVENLTSYIAFKATMNENSVIAKGEIFDSEGIRLTTFESSLTGTGKFKLTPSLRRSYTAKVTFGDGTTKNYPLPQAKQQGMVLSIDNSDKAKIKIKVLKNINAKTTIVAHQHGKIYQAIEGKANKSIITTEINRYHFPAGIVQFTLLDEHNIPHAERLVYVNHFETLDISLNTNKNEYQKREKVSIDLDIDEAEGDFSVAVTDANSVQVQENDILSYSLLTSELKGKIENPAFYLSQTQEAEAALDNLLLTQGWRRFTWKDKPITYPLEESLYVSGEVESLFGKAKNGNLLMLMGNNLEKSFATIIDENGKFIIGGLDFQGNMKGLIQGETNSKNKLVNIALDKKTFPLISENQEALTLNSLSAFLKQSIDLAAVTRAYEPEEDIKLLKSVTVKERKIDIDLSKKYNKPYLVADKTIKTEVIARDIVGGNPLSSLMGKAPWLVVNPGSCPIIKYQRSNCRCPPTNPPQWNECRCWFIYRNESLPHRPY